MKYVKQFIQEEDGIGIVELILILVILIALVLVFKTKIQGVIDNAWKSFDKDTKDTEIVKLEEDIEVYMQREVLPHVPDAVAFFEENLGAKKPVIKTGAEIPFTRYFYKYQSPTPSSELENQFMELELSVSELVDRLFE